jgi:hypothetical protein
MQKLNQEGECITVVDSSRSINGNKIINREMKSNGCINGAGPLNIGSIRHNNKQKSFSNSGYDIDVSISPYVSVLPKLKYFEKSLNQLVKSVLLPKFEINYRPSFLYNRLVSDESDRSLPITSYGNAMCELNLMQI